MKIIFLDFDGVLNTETSYSSTGNFSKAACKNLNKILSGCPEAKIVVSSHWRRKGITKVKQVLEKNGIDTSRVIGMTDKTDRDDRGHHIERYIKDNKGIEKYTILDNENDMDKILDHLVQTSPMVGITEKDVKKALAMLI